MIGRWQIPFAVCGCVLSLTSLPLAAQEAQPPASSATEPVPLPPLTVEAKQNRAAKPKAKAKPSPAAPTAVPAEPEIAPAAEINALSTMTPPAPYAGGQVATGGQIGLLGNKSVMDTPFNQISYTSKTIKDQQARTVSDVMANDPSVTLQTSGSAGNQETMIRGFYYDSARVLSINGLSGILPNQAAAFLERVEVLKGPSALVNGMPVSGGAIGGSVNAVAKRAGDDPLTQITTSYESDSLFGTHVDVGRRYGVNKEFGVRFNGVYRDGDGAVDPSETEHGLATLGLDYRGEHVRFSADLGYQNFKVDSQTRPIFLADPTMPVPRAPDASRSFTPDWTHYYFRDLFGTVQGEVDLTENVTAYAALGGRKSDGDVTFVLPFVNDALGNWGGPSLRQANFNDTFAGQAGLRTTVDTGPVNHALNFNVSQSRQELGFQNAFGPFVVSNLYNPPLVPDPHIAAPDARKSSDSKRTSVGVADTVSIFDDRVQFTAGVRRQQVESTNFDIATGAEIGSYDSFAWTPAYALVVRPLENVSLYANYIEGLEEGFAVDASYANAGQVFAPYKSKQHEVGVKVDWGQLTTTVSAFEISQPNVITLPTAPLPTLSLDGEQVNRGIEINAFGELTAGLRVLGGVMFLDARQAKTEGGLFDDNKAAGVPDYNVVLGGEWDLPFLSGLTLTGRVQHSGAAFYDQANLQLAPDWTRVDLGARYAFVSPWNNEPATIRFDVLNVADKDYWLAGPSSLALAAPRTYLVSTTFDF